jgi:hypothetical protein
MLALYRLRCDHSFLVWPRSLTALHNTSDLPVGSLRRPSGQFTTVPAPAPPLAGPPRDERAARVV